MRQKKLGTVQLISSVAFHIQIEPYAPWQQEVKRLNNFRYRYSFSTLCVRSIALDNFLIEAHFESILDSD